MCNKIIGVTFEHSSYAKEYAFACYIDDIRVGDTVVVETVNGLMIATVVNLDATLPGKKTLKQVVDKVDMAAFEERKQKAEKVKKLKTKIEKKVKELQDIALYEMLAEKDPELKNMVSELKGLI